jgi:hypothetical protein
VSFNDFSKVSEGIFEAPFMFFTEGEQPTLYSVESSSSMIPLYVPAGNYTVTETSASSVDGKVKSAPAYSLTIYGEVNQTTATNVIPINEQTAGYNNDRLNYRFTVTNSYSDPYNPGPTYYTLTVRWVDEDGSNLATPVSSSLSAGSAYDAQSVNGGSGRAFDGYAYKGLYAGSDDVAGTMYGNKTVIFEYTESIIITEPPVPEGSAPPSEPVEEIEEEETPKASVPVATIEDPDVPLADAPATGESILLYFLITLLLASASGLAWIISQEYRERLSRKKK